MTRSFWSGIFAVALLGAAAGTSAAQETATPIFKAPYRAFEHSEIGLSLSDPGEGVSVAFEGFYRYGSGPYDFSLRGGLADFEGPGNTGVLIGGDFSTQVVHYTESFPLDGALTVGLGGVFGSDIDDIVLLPVGISLGRAFDLENSKTVFVPYVHPVIVPVFGSPGDDVQFALGLGVDIKFSDRWSVRASGGLGDIEGVGVSVAYLR